MLFAPAGVGRITHDEHLNKLVKAGTARGRVLNGRGIVDTAFGFRGDVE